MFVFVFFFCGSGCVLVVVLLLHLDSCLVLVPAVASIQSDRGPQQDFLRGGYGHVLCSGGDPGSTELGQQTCGHRWIGNDLSHVID